VHDLTPIVLRRTQTTKKKLAFWAQLQLLRFADRVVADSVCTLTDLRNLHLLPRDSTDVVYAGPGVTPSADDDGFASDLRPFALYVGGHGLHKNLARLMAAVARLPSSMLPRVVITGWSNRTLLANTLRHANVHRVRDRVIVMPAGLSDERLSALYRHCAAFVYPSLYEGFGLPVLEAMAHGAPVACSGVSSIPEVGGNAVLYFDPTSIDEIAMSIRDIITHPSLASALRERGVEQSSRFTWTRTASQILAIAKRAAEEKHSRRPQPSPPEYRQV
jgi:glycosyltransferase involved in cell wall biosynthesis